MANLTIQTIKQQLHNNGFNNAPNSNLPKHWVIDWLLHVINQPNSFLITNNSYELTDDEQCQFLLGIKKMQAGTPLAYLIGRQAFWSLDFFVDEHTLIPRPDTEVLIEQVLTWIKKQIKKQTDEHTNKQKNSPNKNKLSNETNIAPFKLLDLGTGSGCIAISLAHELACDYPNQWQITATDISLQALEVAKKNAQYNQISNIDFIQSDWYGALSSSNHPKPSHQDYESYQVIVSNPPYINKSDDHLPKLSAEPITALVAEDNGLADIKTIIFGAADYLVEGGLLAIEHGYQQAASVKQLFVQAGFKEVATIKDYGGNDRVTMGVYK